MQKPAHFPGVGYSLGNTSTTQAVELDTLSTAQDTVYYTGSSAASPYEGRKTFRPLPVVPKFPGVGHILGDGSSNENIAQPVTGDIGTLVAQKSDNAPDGEDRQSRRLSITRSIASQNSIATLESMQSLEWQSAGSSINQPSRSAREAANESAARSARSSRRQRTQASSPYSQDDPLAERSTVAFPSLSADPDPSTAQPEESRATARESTDSLAMIMKAVLNKLNGGDATLEGTLAELSLSDATPSASVVPPTQRSNLQREVNSSGSSVVESHDSSVPVTGAPQVNDRFLLLETVVAASLNEPIVRAGVARPGSRTGTVNAVSPSLTASMNDREKFEKKVGCLRCCIIC